MAKPVLSDEKLGEFATGMGGEPKPEANGAAAGSSADANAGAPAGATDSADAGGAGNEGRTEEKGPIPYERFSEVNRQKNEALERIKEFEEKIASQPQLARDEASRILVEIAEKGSPELKAAIYGDEYVKEQERANGAAANADPAAAKDPTQQKIASLEKQVAQNQQWQAYVQRREMIDDLTSRSEAQMEKHAIFKNPEARRIGEILIGQTLISRRDAAAEKVVDEVAGQLTAFEEATKAQYKGAKVATAKTVPAGAGNGGAAPPGAAPRKLSLNDGSTARALAAALRGLTSE